jgi:hypothetical protein
MVLSPSLAPTHLLGRPILSALCSSCISLAYHKKVKDVLTWRKYFSGGKGVILKRKWIQGGWVYSSNSLNFLRK